VLTFTLAAGLTVEDGPDAGRELLIAAIGCNLAWGIIDGAMYLTERILERSRRQRSIRAVQEAADEAEQLAVVQGRVDEVLGEAVTAHATEAERARLMGFVRDLALRASTDHTPVRREDLLGALASGWLVIATALPAAVPFLLIDRPWVALRVSNTILVGMLFVVGWQWGKYGYVNRWLAGTIFLVVGLALVATAIALGG
jgi:VIT1/CCC1 family predicted Fe2+/Mn2+ transporter